MPGSTVIFKYHYKKEFLGQDIMYSRLTSRRIQTEFIGISFTITQSTNRGSEVGKLARIAELYRLHHVSMVTTFRVSPGV